MMNATQGEIEYPIYRRNIFTSNGYESFQSMRRKVPIIEGIVSLHVISKDSYSSRKR
jgi:hypothetical protein